MNKYIISSSLNDEVTFLGFYDGFSSEEAVKDALYTIDDEYKPDIIVSGKVTCFLITEREDFYIKSELTLEYTENTD